MTDNPSSHGENQLLYHLDGEVMSRLHSKLIKVWLEPQQVLYHPEQPISEIYFPDTAVLCMLTIMRDGHSVESATVGNEGASWVSASLGAPTMPCQTMVAVGGMAHRLHAKDVETEIRRNGLFHDLVSEYAHALLITSLRTGACNAIHSLTQRCARWMLVALDRSSSERLVITHEFLAALLGCSRSVMTTTLGELENRGGIRTGRGKIEVIDRHVLRDTACECYSMIRDNFDSLRERASQLRSIAESR
jgi:Crp-like helix-turn-helix protein